MATSIDAILRDERPRVVAMLARRFGDLDLAEDATQEAMISALSHWPADGLPDRPGAWLMTTAYRKAVDLLRKKRPSVDLDAVLHVTGDPGQEPDFAGDAISDDVLALLLTCCHPSLDTPSRLALALRHVCGLTASEIATGFVLTEAAVAKRLVRVKQKITRAGITFSVPDGARLDERVEDVRTVIYVLFTEGHLSTGTSDGIRADLCDEAIWLCRQLDLVRPGDGATLGLLALMLIQRSRLPARVDHQGKLVQFSDQDRDNWDYKSIEEARALLAQTGSSPLGRYQVEGAIALLLVSGDEPDWTRIADLYGVLSRIAPSPIVEVNRALAVGTADGPPAGLSILHAVIEEGRLTDYVPLHTVRAELLVRSGDTEGARQSYLRAADLTANDLLRDALQKRADATGTRRTY